MDPQSRVRLHSPSDSSLEKALWSEMARRWRLAAPPLRPSPRDVALYQAITEDWIAEHGTPRVLLLGVTPDLYHLSWPDRTDFLAVDQTQTMIDLVWPGPASSALCADWSTLALPDGSRDMILCDGGLHLLAPTAQRDLVQTLHRILSPQGICVFRLFVPDPDQSAAGVLADLHAGRMSGINLLKLRLDLALQADYETGVALGTVWDTLHAGVPDLNTIATTCGWPRESVHAVDAYRGSEVRYHFPDLEQARTLFEAGNRFQLEAVHTPDMPFGRLHPTVLLRRSPTA